MIFSKTSTALNTGKVPEIWKKADAVVLFKRINGGPDNCRPVTDTDPRF